MNMKSKILAIASLAMFAGCIAPKTAGVWVEKGNLNIEDPAFATNIEIVRDIREKTNEGFLHVQVSVMNTNRTDYECLYRFEWRGKNGMIQKHAMAPWRPVVLHGRTPEDFDAVSPLQDTEDFRLVIRRKN